MFDTFIWHVLLHVHLRNFRIFQSVSEEVSKTEKADVAKSEPGTNNGTEGDTGGAPSVTEVKKGKVTIMVAVAKKKAEPTKGELMEANIDAMEVRE